MSQWIETYRGAVPPWEADVVEHLTVAYYFDRFSDSTLALMEEVGLGAGYRTESRRAFATVDSYVRYLEELRVGDVLHIDSAILEVDDKGIRMGHKVFNSATGALCATMEQYVLHFDLVRRKAAPVAAELREALARRQVAWDGPKRERRPVPSGDAGFLPAYRDTAKPWEIDVLGHVGFQFLIHRFSAAAAQLNAAFGLTPAYLKDERRGMSTFEFQLRFMAELHAGDLIQVKSALVAIGNTSFRIVHRMYNGRTGRLSAELSQFAVHLDLDARRPAPFPEDVRERAAAILVTPDAS